MENAQDTTNEQPQAEAPKAKVTKPRPAIKRPSATAKPVKPNPKAAKPAKATAAPKASTPKPEKPSVPMYNFTNGYEGPSDGINSNTSRTPIQLERFGQFKDANLTDRDQKNMEMLRHQFGEKPFERRNLDAGILKRLGERGCLVHVSGSAVAPDAKFKLTAKGLGKPEGRARKAA